MSEPKIYLKDFEIVEFEEDPIGTFGKAGSGVYYRNLNDAAHNEWSGPCDSVEEAESDIKEGAKADEETKITEIFIENGWLFLEDQEFYLNKFDETWFKVFVDEDEINVKNLNSLQPDLFNQTVDIKDEDGDVIYGARIDALKIALERIEEYAESLKASAPGM